MKILLVGGPHDGEIHDMRRRSFGLGLVSVHYKEGKFLRADEDYYEHSHEQRRHPCKKKGFVNIYKFKESKALAEADCPK